VKAEGGFAQIRVYAYAGMNAVLGPDGQWKALSVQFKNAEIVSVEMHVTAADGSVPAPTFGSSAAGAAGPDSDAFAYFQVVDLSGQNFVYSNGLAATVTFASTTDMDLVFIDYASFNTYLIQLECASTITLEDGTERACGSLPPVTFGPKDDGSTIGTAVVVVTTALEVYAFSGTDCVGYVTLGFNHTYVESWTRETPDPSYTLVGNDASFGVYTLSGTFLPTGVPLITVEVPSGASGDAGCVGPCIDPDPESSNMESELGGIYDVVFIYDAPTLEFSLYDPCATCPPAPPSAGELVGGACSATDDGICAGANGLECGACSCDGVLAPGQLLGFAPLCAPEGATCTALTYQCYAGASECAPGSCYVPEP